MNQRAKKDVINDSDSDFEVEPKKGKKRKYPHATNIDTSTTIGGTSETMSPIGLHWDQLPVDMQSVLPPDDEYTYVIRSHVVQESKQFDGAPDFAFSALNLENPEEVNTWLKR